MSALGDVGTARWRHWAVAALRCGGIALWQHRAVTASSGDSIER